MELCEGTLKQYVRGKLNNIPTGSIDNKIVIGEIVVGLSYLHGQKIIHKDLKPENILMWRNSSGMVLVKLADFGFCKKLRPDQSDFSKTFRLGTTGYIAPELLNNNNPSFESDIWSLGVVIFFVLTGGDHPFGEKGFYQELVIRSKAPILNLEPIAAHWDATDLLRTLLDPEPRNRPNIFLILFHPFFSLMHSTSKAHFTFCIDNRFSGLALQNLLITNYYFISE